MFAAITSSVSAVTIFTLFAKCNAFASVVAIRSPVKLPGPMEICTCSICSGFLPKRFRMPPMAGKISALCLSGAEKVVSSSIFLPMAIATEPILLDVSRAKIRVFCVIIKFFCCLKVLLCL